MKTRTRSSAGASGQPAGAGASPVGDRLPSAPRERKPALAALAVLLILVGALGATVLVVQAGDRVEVVKITHRVAVGQHIPKSSIESVMVADDESMKYVQYQQADLLQTKYWAKADLLPGTLLVGNMLKGSAGVDDGRVVVGVSLGSNQYPAQLAPGDTVAVYRVGDQAGTSDSGDEAAAAGGGALLAAKAKVAKIDKPGDGSLSSDLPVSLRVKQSEAAAVAKAASADEVALVIVPAAD